MDRLPFLFEMGETLFFAAGYDLGLYTMRGISELGSISAFEFAEMLPKMIGSSRKVVE